MIVLGLVMFSMACASVPKEVVEPVPEIVVPEIDIDATIAAKLQILQQ